MEHSFRSSSLSMSCVKLASLLCMLVLSCNCSDNKNGTKPQLQVSDTNNTAGDLDYVELKDAQNATVPWWKRRPYPLRQRPNIPCECADFTCGCCAGIELKRLNISQRGCLNLRYDPDEFSIEMEMLMNERAVLRRSVSAKNPPPLCIPLPIPGGFLPTVSFCTKLYNIFTPGRNLHMCLDWITNINDSPVLEMQFDCLRFGVDGIALVKPDAGGGLGPDITSTGGGTTGGGATGGGGGLGVEEGGDDYDALEPDYPETGNKKKPKPKPSKNKRPSNTTLPAVVKPTINTTKT